MRHEGLRATNFQLRTRNDKVKSFGALLDDTAFMAKVKEVHNATVDDERIKKLREEIHKATNALIVTPSAAVPHSPAARHAAVRELLAMLRTFGLPSVFWTIAPDVHNQFVIRLSFKSRDNTSFPAVNMQEFMDRFKEGTDYVEKDGEGSHYVSVTVKLDTPTLTADATKNPIAVLMVSSVFID